MNPITIHIEPQAVRDMIINALEQGSGYWARTDWGYRSVDALYPDEGDGVALIVTEVGDCPDDVLTEHVITKDKINAAFDIVRRTCAKRIIADLMSGESDAESADCLFQAATLGEVRYG